MTNSKKETLVRQQSTKSINSSDTNHNNNTVPSGRQVIDVVLPTYILEPEEEEKFYPSQAKEIAQDILKAELHGKVDEKWIEDWLDYGDDFEFLSKDIADKIKQTCKDKLHIPRYKIVVQVTIGQKKDQGVCLTSRCLWATSTDNYASATYQNEFIWASAIVFGLYSD